MNDYKSQKVYIEIINFLPKEYFGKNYQRKNNKEQMYKIFF